MTLERYVLLENGMVIDQEKHNFVGVADLGKNSYYEKDGKLIWENAFSFMPDYPLGKILATSPDIWGLVKEGWLAICYESYPESVYVDEKHEIWKHTSNNSLTTCQEEITALFAPITENGVVVRYERVWEREETK